MAQNYSERDRALVRLTPFLTDPNQWDCFCELLRFERYATLERLVNAADPRDVATFQAQVRFIDRMLALKDELKKLQARQ